MQYLKKSKSLVINSVSLQMYVKQNFTIITNTIKVSYIHNHLPWKKKSIFLVILLVTNSRVKH